MIMEYTVTKEELKNPLLVETLHALAECYAALNMELYVVGAVARDLALRLLQINDPYRGTLDLDVAVLLADWEQYQQLTETLLNHQFLKAAEKQRFYYVGTTGNYRYMVDIVPFGTIAHQELLAWPPDGHPVMSVRCFDDVMAHADTVSVDNALSFRIASLSGQFLIKLDAWSDRHALTKKDASDMVNILRNVYVAYALSRQALPPEINIEASEFDVVVAGAEWIASDLCLILSKEHRQFYATMLQNEVNQEEDSVLINDLLDASDARQYTLFRRAIKRMAQILATTNGGNDPEVQDVDFEEVK